MKNKADNKAFNRMKTEVLKFERDAFNRRILATAVGHISITFWLNAIRITAPSWFVLVLIVIQFALYFSTFIISYQRSKVYGLNKNLAICIFTVLAFLGRVNDWEFVIIPLLVVIMILFSAKNKNISDESYYYPKNDGTPASPTQFC